MNVGLAAAGRIGRDFNSSSVDLFLSYLFLFVFWWFWKNDCTCLKWKWLIKLEADHSWSKPKRNKQWISKKCRVLLCGFVCLTSTCRTPFQTYVSRRHRHGRFFRYISIFFCLSLSLCGCTRRSENPHVETCEFVQEEKIPCEFSFDLLYVRCHRQQRTTSISCLFLMMRVATTLRTRRFLFDLRQQTASVRSHCFFFFLLLIVLLFASAQYE